MGRHAVAIGMAPVPREPCGPPLRHKLFTADTAGVADGEVNDGAGVGGVICH